MEYSCNQYFIRFNEANTIVKAIELMKKEFNINDNFNITLNKHLPTQAGLAGGSTDGAAIIRALNKMYTLNLSDEKIKEAYMENGLMVKVPLFIEQGEKILSEDFNMGAFSIIILEN